jgi:hypothetical protein
MLTLLAVNLLCILGLWLASLSVRGCLAFVLALTWIVVCSVF